jgi:hypothetical protein
MEIIVVSQTPRYIMTVELDGVNYILYFNWSVREECWYLTLFSGDSNPDEDTPIISNIKIVVGIFLLEQYKAIADLPSGDFMVIKNDTISLNNEISFDNFGVDFLLVYFTEEKVAEIKGEI